MCYKGLIREPDYASKSENETISGQWVFLNGLDAQGEIKGINVTTRNGDVAEYYKVEFEELIPVGSLVKFGKTAEVTKTVKGDKNCFGVISTKPAIKLNNKEKNDDTYKPVALMGRVPCRIVGKVHKFDKLTVSNVPGVAKKKTLLDTLLFKKTIGISLEENLENKEKIIEIFVRCQL